MKKLLSAVVSLVTALSFTAIAMAIPATDDMNKSISTLESEGKGAPEASKPKAVQKKKAHKKHRKSAKKEGVNKEAAPASTQAPSSGASSTQPAPATK